MNAFEFEDGPRRARRAERVPGGWGVEIGKAVGFMLLGVALAYGILRASGGDVADRQTVKIIEALREWASNPETRRKMDAAIKDLEKGAKELRESSRKMMEQDPFRK